MGAKRSDHAQGRSASEEMDLSGGGTNDNVKRIKLWRYAGTHHSVRRISGPRT